MVLISANYTMASATFPAQVESVVASVNVKAVIRAAFLRLRARNSVDGDGGGGDGGLPGRVQGFRGENGTVIPGRNWIDGFLT